MNAGLPLVLALALIGCHAPAEPVETPSRAPVAYPSPPAWSADAQRLYERTLVRDPVPSCAVLTADLTEPARALVEVSERAVAPPSSGMRAAACALERAAEVEPALLRWVGARETLGLALLVLGQLDRLDEALALRLADAALAGPNASEARPRIARSTRHSALRLRAASDADLTR
jgi:hypothetical protein